MQVRLDQLRLKRREANPLLEAQTTYVWNPGHTLKFMHRVNLTYSQMRMARTFLREHGLKSGRVSIRCAPRPQP
jgi:hypothetical protein